MEIHVEKAVIAERLNRNIMSCVDFTGVPL